MMNVNERDLTKKKIMEKIKNKNLTNEGIVELTQKLTEEFIDTKRKITAEDKKLNSVGKALIEQRKILEEIYKVQGSYGMKLSESLMGASHTQREITKQAQNLSSSLDDINDVRDEQKRYVDDLNKFQDTHQKLIDISKAQSEKSTERLKEVSGQVARLFERIDNIGIEGQVNSISNSTESISKMLEVHANKQAQVREDASNSMLDLLADVTSFGRQLSEDGLSGKLDDIHKASNIINQKIKSLDDKFETFIDLYEPVKVEEAEELEEIFSEEVSSCDKKVLRLEEPLEEVIDGEPLEEVVEDVTGEEPEEGPEEEVMGISGDDVEEEDEDGISYSEKIPEYGRIEKEEGILHPEKKKKKEEVILHPEKKKSFLNKLFGGR